MALAGLTSQAYYDVEIGGNNLFVFEVKDGSKYILRIRTNSHRRTDILKELLLSNVWFDKQFVPMIDVFATVLTADAANLIKRHQRQTEAMWRTFGYKG